MIGKKGQMLKIIGTQARKELEKMLDKKVYLELSVKVSKDWRKKNTRPRKLGIMILKILEYK